MRILKVTDAWYPQINGVVRSVATFGEALTRQGHHVHYMTPLAFRSTPCPSYPEIRLAVAPWRKVAGIIETFRPEAVHIATEGPLGLAARRYCLAYGMAFTTAFHTRFPEYLQPRFFIPARWTYRLVRRFHAPAERCIVATERLARDLAARGFQNTAVCPRGVDTAVFRPGEAARIPGPRPVQLFVGRVAVEKNLQAFLALDRPGTKVVVGDGPQKAELQRHYPDVHFAGVQTGHNLVRYYNAADVFVFPSRTDTLGLVLLEALACGVPVAAYPVMGPLDVIGDAPVGCLDADLNRAIDRALTVPRATCRAFAQRHSWDKCVQRFAALLVPNAAGPAAPVCPNSE